MIKEHIKMEKFIENAKRYSTVTSNISTIKYYSANSDVAKVHTELLRQAQSKINYTTGEEEIVFCLANGLNLQYADGSGRRLILSRGEDHSFFSYPAWSLDGTRIAFSANRLGDPRIVDLAVANADGSDAQIILSLTGPGYESYIYSISWSWDSEYIMFSFAYDDFQQNDYFNECIIHWSGESFIQDTNVPDRIYCKFEPITSSIRYAYILNGSAINQNSELYVSNLDGTGSVLWARITDVINGFGNLVWNTPSSIYAVVRYLPDYPNRELLLRFDRSGGNTTNTIISQSDVGASLWTPTLSPDREFLYNVERTDQTSIMYLVQMYPTPLFIQKGVGFYPNWRQSIPQVPSVPELISPKNNIVLPSSEIEFNWNTISNSTEYEIQVDNDISFNQPEISALVYTNSHSASLEAKSSTYYWKVRAKHQTGWGEWSSTWNFMTLLTSVSRLNSEIPNKYNLYQNYPNPFNPVTNITYYLPKAGDVQIILFDALGNEIKSLVDDYYTVGKYNVEISMKNLPSGTYIYRLLTENYSKSKKMVFLK